MQKIVALVFVLLGTLCFFLDAVNVKASVKWFSLGWFCAGIAAFLLLV
jgi:hypothetical protein